MNCENLKVGDSVAVIATGGGIYADIVAKKTKAYITLKNGGIFRTCNGREKSYDSWDWRDIEPLTEKHIQQIEEKKISAKFRAIIGDTSLLYALSLESKKRILAAIAAEAELK